jgi:hypothetical protein
VIETSEVPFGDERSVAAAVRHQRFVGHTTIPHVVWPELRNGSAMDQMGARAPARQPANLAEPAVVAGA